jgi:hypothetical protein
MLTYADVSRTCRTASSAPPALAPSASPTSSAYAYASAVSRDSRRIASTTRLRMSAYVSICQHVSAYSVEGFEEDSEHNQAAYLSISQHMPAYASIRQHMSAYVSIRDSRRIASTTRLRTCPHTSAHVSTRQHTSAQVSTRICTSVFVLLYQ